MYRTTTFESRVRVWVVALVLWLASGLTASAQLPPSAVGRNPISRPTVSPYLNLLNNSRGGTTFDYYNFVRPQQQFRQAATQLSNELGSLKTNVNQLRQTQGSGPAPTSSLLTGRMAPTGHSSSFNSLGGYFQSSSGTQGTAAPRR